MHFSNGRFSNKETGFSGALVVGGLLGAAGEKKKRKPNVPIIFAMLRAAPNSKSSQKFAKLFLIFCSNFWKIRSKSLFFDSFQRNLHRF